LGVKICVNPRLKVKVKQFKQVNALADGDTLWDDLMIRRRDFVPLSGVFLELCLFEHDDVIATFLQHVLILLGHLLFSIPNVSNFVVFGASNNHFR
jgi:hypothetical protein